MNTDEIQTLGASLRRISQKLLKKDSASQIFRVWYQGGEPYFDIFFDLHGEDILWFQFTLRGQSITWEKNKPGLETGFTHENQIEAAKYPASKLIETENRADCQFIQLACAILQTRTDEAPFVKAIALLEKEIPCTS
ncbi:MAG: hypothetical protein LRZ84_06075 [Desertifilum sp.]|nr:hypothetical protein [Desertifilum sp.]